MRRSMNTRKKIESYDDSYLRDYDKLNTKGKATKKIMEITSDDIVRAGIRTYRLLKHLLVNYSTTAPFPFHITQSIGRALNTLRLRGYISDDDRKKINSLIYKKIIAKDKIRSVKTGKLHIPTLKERLGLLSLEKKSDPLYRIAYPETFLKECDDYALDFLIWYMGHKIKKGHRGKWKLITDFFKEQDIIERKSRVSSIEKKYKRNGKYIGHVYAHIYYHYPVKSAFTILDENKKQHFPLYIEDGKKGKIKVGLPVWEDIVNF